jgi:threonine/homoserine/homoserine lactone efflux protein
MDWGTLAALILFALAMVLTPGPNNLIATASGANFGIRRTLPFIAGAVFGFVLMVAILFAGGGAAIAAIPGAMTALKIAGTLYLLWLAWRIAVADPGGADAATAARPLGFGEAALIAPLNPKSWMMVFAAIGGYAGAAPGPLAFAAVGVAVFGLVMPPAMLLWTALGAGVGRLGRAHLRWLNRAMAALIVASVALIYVE